MGRHRRSAPLTSDEAAAGPRAAREPLTSETTEHLDPAEAPTVPIPVVPPTPDLRPGTGRHRSPHRPVRKDREPEGAPQPRKPPEPAPAPAPAAAAAAAGTTAKAPTKKASAKTSTKAPTRKTSVKPPAKASARTKAPARTGLLGASAAVAMGAVAMVSGLLPGNPLSVGDSNGAGHGGTSGQVRADAPIDVPSAARQQKPPAARHFGPTVPAARPEAAASRAYEREAAPATPAARVTPAVVRPSTTSAPRSAEATPAEARTTGASAPRRPGSGGPTGTPESAPSTAASHQAAAASAAASASASAAVLPAAADDDPAAHAAARAAEGLRGSAARTVVALVNAERAKAGCRPLHTDARLTSLAQSFSDDMARRGFFDHTDPDGRSPWDRATRRGIRNLGGENIARGHPDPHTVVEAWMRSAGHRQNILNCDYRSLGVGIHHGPGGPWWTQDFGY